jgi:transposase
MGEVKRRSWTIEQKRAICLEARQNGMSVSEVSQRHRVNANLVFKWLRDPRFIDAGYRVDAFFPVEICQDQALVGGKSDEEPTVVRISVHGGHSIDIPPGSDPDFLGRLLKAWLQ